MQMKRQVDLGQVRGIIWDFDGVFYDYDALPNSEFYTLCDQANAKAACDIIPGLDFDEAAKLARQSYVQHHDSIGAFLPLAAQHGISEQELKTRIFYAYHEELLKAVLDKHPEFFAPQAGTIAAFQALHGKVEHVILTHACAERWAKPVLDKMQKRHFFKPDHILGFEEFDFINTGASPFPIETALKKLGLPPHQVIFVEDSKKHLEVAKTAYPDLITALKTNDPTAAADPYVDITIRRPYNLVNHLATNHHRPRPGGPRGFTP